jgi:hypothetical protein
MYSNEDETSLVVMSGRKLLSIIVIGMLIGLMVWGLTWLLDTYIYKALLCHTATAKQCVSSSQYAMITATIISAIVGLLGLVRLQVYRPLLIVIASFISLWGLVSLVLPMAWYVELITIIGLYGLSFGLFAWVARIRHFLVASIVVILLVIAVRFFLNS